ncbi:MAG: hypothetical protein KAI89_09250, partial [Emcibacter sp.]|nr:hypothetical protein [Emcibacter sp.]
MPKKSRAGKLKIFFLTIISLLLIVYYVVLPKYASHMDASVNKIINTERHFGVNAKTQTFHDRLIIADLHADFLLW